MAKNSADYFAEYYKRNRAAILAKRRLRYQNDPVYREKMQKKARIRAQKKAVFDGITRLDRMRAEAKRLEETDVDIKGLGPQMFKRWPIGDLVTSSVICGALDVSLGTLFNWLKSGVLPEPTITTSAGKHLFSLLYFDLVRSCRIQSLSIGGRTSDFARIVKAAYATIVQKELKLRSGG